MQTSPRSSKIAIGDSYLAMEYGIADAKNNLPKLIKAALQGERVMITNRGADAVELVRVSPATRMGFGSMPGLAAALPAGWDSVQAKGELTAQFEDLT